MSFMTRLAAFAGYEKRAADPSWSALAPWTGASAGYSARAAENLSSVLACTGAIASALASIPALVYARDGKGNRSEALDHPVSLITRYGANSQMTFPDFIEHLMTSTLLTGNGLAEIVRGGNGSVIELRFWPWGRVSALQLTSGRLAYDVQQLNGRTRRLLEGEVIHIKERTDDTLIGRSRLSRAASTVQGVMAANDFGQTFLERGAQPSGVISSDKAMTGEQLSQLREQFDSKHAGVANAGRPMVLDDGLKWVASQISPEDAELLATRKFGVEEICRLYQVPPPLVQDYSHNTFTNSETAGRWFAMFCLTPWARKIEAEFARSVFPIGGPYELEFDLSGFLRGDPQTRWAAHKIALDGGVLDPDEVRQVEGWNPRQMEGTGV
jgi:HK97 family phage portal protein